MKKLPTLKELLEIDTYKLTDSQYGSCVQIANVWGVEACQEQAKKFNEQNSE